MSSQIGWSPLCADASSAKTAATVAVSDAVPSRGGNAEVQRRSRALELRRELSAFTARLDQHCSALLAGAAGGSAAAVAAAALARCAAADACEEQTPGTRIKLAAQDNQGDENVVEEEEEMHIQVADRLEEQLVLIGQHRGNPSRTRPPTRKLCCIVPREALSVPSHIADSSSARRLTGFAHCYVHLLRGGGLQVGTHRWSRRFPADGLVRLSTAPHSKTAMTSDGAASVEDLADDLEAWCRTLRRGQSGALSFLAFGVGSPELCSEILPILPMIGCCRQNPAGEQPATNGNDFRVYVSGLVLGPGAHAPRDLWDPAHCVSVGEAHAKLRTRAFRCGPDGIDELVRALRPVFEVACTWQQPSPLPANQAATCGGGGRHVASCNGGGAAAVSVSFQWNKPWPTRFVVTCATGTGHWAVDGLERWLAAEAVTPLSAGAGRVPAAKSAPLQRRHFNGSPRGKQETLGTCGPVGVVAGVGAGARDSLDVVLSFASAPLPAETWNSAQGPAQGEIRSEDGGVGGGSAPGLVPDVWLAACIGDDICPNDLRALECLALSDSTKKRGFFSKTGAKTRQQQPHQSAQQQVPPHPKVSKPSAVGPHRSMGDLATPRKECKAIESKRDAHGGIIASPPSSRYVSGRSAAIQSAPPGQLRGRGRGTSTSVSLEVSPDQGDCSASSDGDGTIGSAPSVPPGETGPPRASTVASRPDVAKKLSFGKTSGPQLGSCSALGAAGEKGVPKADEGPRAPDQHRRGFTARERSVLGRPPRSSLPGKRREDGVGKLRARVCQLSAAQSTQEEGASSLEQELLPQDSTFVPILTPWAAVLETHLKATARSSSDVAETEGVCSSTSTACGSAPPSVHNFAHRASTQSSPTRNASPPAAAEISADARDAQIHAARARAEKDSERWRRVVARQTANFVNGNSFVGFSKSPRPSHLLPSPMHSELDNSKDCAQIQAMLAGSPHSSHEASVCFAFGASEEQQHETAVRSSRFSAPSTLGQLVDMTFSALPQPDHELPASVDGEMESRNTSPFTSSEFVDLQPEAAAPDEHQPSPSSPGASAERMVPLPEEVPELRQPSRSSPSSGASVERTAPLFAEGPNQHKPSPSVDSSGAIVEYAVASPEQLPQVALREVQLDPADNVRTQQDSPPRWTATGTRGMVEWWESATSVDIEYRLPSWPSASHSEPHGPAEGVNDTANVVAVEEPDDAPFSHSKDTEQTEDLPLASWQAQPTQLEVSRSSDEEGLETRMRLDLDDIAALGHEAERLAGTVFQGAQHLGVEWFDGRSREAERTATMGRPQPESSQVQPVESSAPGEVTHVTDSKTGVQHVESAVLEDMDFVEVGDEGADDDQFHLEARGIAAERRATHSGEAERAESDGRHDIRFSGGWRATANSEAESTESRTESAGLYADRVAAEWRAAENSEVDPASSGPHQAERISLEGFATEVAESEVSEEDDREAQQRDGSNPHGPTEAALRVNFPLRPEFYGRGVDGFCFPASDSGEDAENNLSDGSSSRLTRIKVCSDGDATSAAAQHPEAVSLADGGGTDLAQIVGDLHQLTTSAIRVVEELAAASGNDSVTSATPPVALRTSAESSVTVAPHQSTEESASADVSDIDVRPLSPVELAAASDSDTESSAAPVVTARSFATPSVTATSDQSLESRRVFNIPVLPSTPPSSSECSSASVDGLLDALGFD